MNDFLESAVKVNNLGFAFSVNYEWFQIVQLRHCVTAVFFPYPLADQLNRISLRYPSLGIPPDRHISQPFALFLVP
jgi:hypothetical protein